MLNIILLLSILLLTNYTFLPLMDINVKYTSAAAKKAILTKSQHPQNKLKLEILLIILLSQNKISFIQREKSLKKKMKNNFLNLSLSYTGH